jgi:sterol 3beta-glucosyltransferase
VLGDQPFWGRRVHALGVGPHPLPLRQATPETLGERIADLVSNIGYTAAATELAARIGEEDGTSDGVRVLEEIERRGVATAEPRARLRATRGGPGGRVTGS